MKIVCKTRIVEPERKGLRLGVEVTADENACGLLICDCAEGCGTVTVDWGDGCVETSPGLRSVVHAYDAPGRYEVRLTDEVGVMQLCAPMPGSKFNTVYPMRFRTIEIAADRLVTLKPYAFVRSVNLETVRIRTAAPLTLPNYCFKDCVSLRRVELPSVADLASTSSISAAPFTGCTAEMEIHFAKANERAIRATQLFTDYPTLGAEKGSVSFDL